MGFFRSVKEYIFRASQSDIRKWEKAMRKSVVLLTRLKESYDEVESELAALKRKWRALDAESPWRWMGDGSDDLDTMSDGMNILITAGDLKRLLEEEYEDGRSRLTLGDRLFQRSDHLTEDHRKAAAIMDTCRSLSDSLNKPKGDK